MNSKELEKLKLEFKKKLKILPLKDQILENYGHDTNWLKNISEIKKEGKANDFVMVRVHKKNIDKYIKLKEELKKSDEFLPLHAVVNWMLEEYNKKTYNKEIKK